MYTRERIVKPSAVRYYVRARVARVIMDSAEFRVYRRVSCFLLENFAKFFIML